uniref:Uncharacterized protein n=2 Tax=Timema TaxID=61471 RepID=A0A7R9H3I2_TIMCR|nr:unnamed protein product [Timema cristinae]
MAFWKEDDEDYWNESDTKSKAKAFNFEEDEYGSQLCGVSRSGAARLGQQVRAGMDSRTTPHSTDSLAGSFSKGMVLEGPEISIRPLDTLISDEALRCIVDAAAGRPRFTKGPVNVEEEVRILRRQLENRWAPPPVDETIKKILLGRPFSLELYRSLALKTELLDAAINMGDGNAILGVVLFLMKTLKKSRVYQLLRTRPAAVNQYSHYLTTRLQVNELTDLLEASLKDPSADNTVRGWISDMEQDIQEGLTEALKLSKFAIQVDEATDSVKDAHLITYVQYINNRSVKEDLLFLISNPKDPSADNTVRGRISDMEDIQEGLTEALKLSKFAIQVDEATDSVKDAHLVTYVRYINNRSVQEDLLFCKPLPGIASAEGVFKILDDLLTASEMKGENCAPAMSGERSGLQALVKSCLFAAL